MGRAVDTTTGEIIDRLDDDEAARLGELEQIISERITAFVEVGQALGEIRDSRLYREEHATFEDYCLKAWDITRSYGYRLIEAAEVVAEMSPIGDTPLPANEAQARALKDIPTAEAKAEVMREAAEDGPVTAKKIRDVVTKRSESPARGREVREETVTTDPVPERDPKAKKAAERADEIARTLTAYPYQMVDERTVRRLEAWCQRWRSQT